MDERRLVRRAILSVGRKNGKTALISALVLANLVGPEAIPNGEIYSAANDREQAAVVFRIARQIVEAEPELLRMVRVVPSTKTLACYGNGSFYRALSSESGTKHGLNPSVVIYDELAQAKSRDLYDVLDTSMGARAEPLFITISTQSNDPEHILSKLIDDGLHSGDPTIVCHLYAVPDETPDEDLYKETTWKLANPALGDFRSIKDMRSIADKAQRMPAEEPKFKNLYLNMRVAPVAALIARAEWMACVGDAAIAHGESVFLGLDLSSIDDLTALVMVSAEGNSRVQPFIWKPADRLLEHSTRDFGAGNARYVEWEKSGDLLTTQGRSIHKGTVALKIAELWGRYRILGMAYDRWRIDDLIKEFDRAGFASYKDGDKGDGLRLVPWGQGFKDMAPAVDALESDVIERRLVHPSNPVLTWNMGNAVAEMDPAGNRKIVKEKARFRVDAAVALAMALGLKARDRKEPEMDVSDFLSSPVFA